VLLLETGGVRLNEANLGLAAIADIQRGVLSLRELAPVVALIAGPTGCFGGMSLVAALCTHIIGTRYARYGMNGPEVIEQEVGPAELDAGDRENVWAVYGCENRFRDGLIDALVAASSESVREGVAAALRGDVPARRTMSAAEQLTCLRAEWRVSDVAVG